MTEKQVNQLEEKQKAFALASRGENHPHVTHSQHFTEVQSLTNETQCIVYNLQTSAVQRMLDFDGM